MKAIIRHSLALLLMLAMCFSIAVPAAASETRSSYDFFRSVGAAKAMEILDTSEFKSYTHRGAANDATNLQNMLDSLNVIDKTNQYRATEGLPALKVSDTYMAMAQINANYAAYTIKTQNKLIHTKEWLYSNHVLDNLASQGGTGYVPNAADAAAGWYAEKNNNGEKGHYLTMMGRNSGVNSTISGSAMTLNPFVVNETFGADQFNERTYTVSQYRQRLKKYMNNQGSGTTAPKKQNSSEVMTYTQSKPIMADSMGIGAPLFLNSSTALLAVPTNGKFEITVNGLEVYNGKLKITLNILNGKRDMYIKGLRNLKFYNGDGNVFFTIPYLNANNYKSLYLATNETLIYYYSGNYNFGKINRCGVTCTMEYTYA